MPFLLAATLFWHGLVHNIALAFRFTFLQIQIVLNTTSRIWLFLDKIIEKFAFFIHYRSQGQKYIHALEWKERCSDGVERGWFVLRQLWHAQTPHLTALILHLTLKLQTSVGERRLSSLFQQFSLPGQECVQRPASLLSGIQKRWCEY